MVDFFNWVGFHSINCAYCDRHHRWGAVATLREWSSHINCHCCIYFSCLVTFPWWEDVLWGLPCSYLTAVWWTSQVLYGVRQLSDLQTYVSVLQKIYWKEGRNSDLYKAFLIQLRVQSQTRQIESEKVSVISDSS